MEARMDITVNYYAGISEKTSKNFDTLYIFSVYTVYVCATSFGAKITKKLTEAAIQPHAESHSYTVMISIIN